MISPEALDILVAEIMGDLTAIKDIQDKVNEKVAELGSEEPTYFDLAAIGYLFHNFYTACENILTRIAYTFENGIEPQRWHADLLYRMKLDIETIRPKVIDNDLYLALDDFRGFRHVFRHAYGRPLDWEKLRLLLNKFPTTVEAFTDQIEKFIRFVKELKAKVS